MKQNGIQLKGFKITKDGRVVRNEKVYAVNIQLKRKGSKRVRYLRGQAHENGG